MISNTRKVEQGRGIKGNWCYYSPTHWLTEQDWMIDLHCMTDCGGTTRITSEKTGWKWKKPKWGYCPVGHKVQRVSHGKKQGDPTASIGEHTHTHTHRHHHHPDYLPACLSVDTVHTDNPWFCSFCTLPFLLSSSQPCCPRFRKHHPLTRRLFISTKWTTVQGDVLSLPTLTLLDQHVYPASCFSSRLLFFLLFELNRAQY